MNNIDFSWITLLYILGAGIISIPISWLINLTSKLPDQEKLSDLDYLKLRKHKAFAYNFEIFAGKVADVPEKIFIKIFQLFNKIFVSIKENVLDILSTFKKGNWAVKLSFVVFGFGNFYYGQIMRGILFLLFEIVFLGYTFFPTGGLYWIKKVQWFMTGSTIGTEQGALKYDSFYDQYVWEKGDDSVRVLLYGLLSLAFVIAFFVTWRMQVKQCRINMEIKEKGKKIKGSKDDLRSLIDEQFYKTLLTPSLLGIIVFTVLPIIYMIIIAFTNYDAKFNGHSNLIQWVGLENFNQFMDFGEGSWGLVLGEMVGWTLMWAFFATFTNYFAGMFVAIIINKKGIRFKKLWRTILVMTIAVPQFVSLMYVGQIFTRQGFLGEFLRQVNLIPEVMLAKGHLSLWENPTSAKILLIIINLWVGIPYVMLQATGILMNIPADLYESSRVDGANSFQQFTKITLPYMLFVTGPSLLTSFVGNLNNFNIIYLLSGGGPTNSDAGTIGGSQVGHTDLLITFLFKVTTGGDSKYYLASVLGIIVFIVVALLSLVIYNVMPSTKNEEDYS